MENHHFEWVNQLSMAIFNSYVSLPEGILQIFGHVATENQRPWQPRNQQSNLRSLNFVGFNKSLTSWVTWVPYVQETLVYIYVYLYTCIPVYIHTYLPTYIHTYIHTYIPYKPERPV